MSRIKARVIDRNRFTKKYPLIRAPRRESFIGDSDLQLEVMTLEFNNQSEVVASYEVPYPDTNFRILLSPRDTTNEDSAQVTVAVDDSVTNESLLKVISSAPFTGKVDVVIIRVV